MVLLTELCGDDDDTGMDTGEPELLLPVGSSPTYSREAPLGSEHYLYSDDEDLCFSSPLLDPSLQANVLDTEDESESGDLDDDLINPLGDVDFIHDLIGVNLVWGDWQNWQLNFDPDDLPWDHPMFVLPPLQAPGYPNVQAPVDQNADIYQWVSSSSDSSVSNCSELGPIYLHDESVNRNLKYNDLKDDKILAPAISKLSNMVKKSTLEVPKPVEKDERGVLNISEFAEEYLLMKRKKASLLQCINLSLINTEHPNFIDSSVDEQNEVLMIEELQTFVSASEDNEDNCTGCSSWDHQPIGSRQHGAPDEEMQKQVAAQGAAQANEENDWRDF